MKHVERMREELSSPPSAEYWQEKQQAGWRPVAVEWERDTAVADGGLRVEVPYGLEVAQGGRHLVENPAEFQAMTLMLQLIAADRPLSAVAEELDRQGFRQRDGSRFTQRVVFELLPRLVEVAPRIYASEEWAARRRPLRRVG